MKETEIIANIWSYSRGLTKWYLNKFNKQQLLYQPTVDGKQLHSPYWIVGHLAWAQNDLAIASTGGEPADFPWLNDFRWNKPEDASAAKLPFSDLLNGFNNVHEQAMNHIRGIPIEGLDNETEGMFKTWRGNLYHSIRHEGVHAGHLGWLCKFSDIETV